MAEYRLRVISPGAGPPQRAGIHDTHAFECCTDGDVYLCGHCGIILRRGDLPLEPVRCSNCGAVNAPVMEEP